MLTKKSKLTVMAMALGSIIAITSCNNEGTASKTTGDTTTQPAPVTTAPADTTQKTDTMKVDTASTRPIKNPT